MDEAAVRPRGFCHLRAFPSRRSRGQPDDSTSGDDEFAWKRRYGGGDFNGCRAVKE